MRLTIKGWPAAVIMVGVVGLWWWMRRPLATPPPPPSPTARPLPVARPVASPDPEVEPAPDSSHVEDALEYLADVEGGHLLVCPDPGFEVYGSPFLRVVPHGGKVRVVAAEVRGQGLVYAMPRGGGSPVGLEGPEVLVRWDADTGSCVFEDVVDGMVTGVVADEQGPVVPSWVSGCGQAMLPVGPDGRFELLAPVGEACLLRADARGDGVWVVPSDGEAVDVVVPWVPMEGTEREEVARRFREELDELDALEGMADPVVEALGAPDLPEAVRPVLEAWRADDAARRAGRRRWLEQTIRRYEQPPPLRLDLEEPDDFSGLQPGGG